MKIVVKHGEDSNKIPLKFDCPKCGCIFVADRDEYTPRFHRSELYYESDCPECGSKAHSH